jgi:pilus assembly protein CpaB
MTTTTTANPTHRLVRKIRLRALLFFGLALVAGALAVFLVKSYMDRASAAAPADVLPTQTVVVAAADLPIGTTLERKHLALAGWPAERTPHGSFDAVELVIGRAIQQNLVEGEPVLAARLADPERGQGMAAILRDGHRAMGVKVDQVIGIAGFVQPGDYVDVITTMRPDDETLAVLDRDTARISKIILQNIRVLAVGEHLATDAHKPVTVSVVTLEVLPDQAEALALASQHGDIQLTMRSRVDQGSVATAGVTPLQLLAPDEGAEVPKIAVTPPPEPPKVSKRKVRRRTKKKEVAKAPPKPERPVVEILRGTKVEERKLRRTADAK